MRLLAILVVPLLAAIVYGGKKNRCKIDKGLDCNSYKPLEPGLEYTIESKTCKNGRYPKNEFCSWVFYINGCTPKVHCDTIDIKGKGKRCRGDRLSLMTSGWDQVLCGKKKDVTIFPDVGEPAYSYSYYYGQEYLDIIFTTDRKRHGKGFSCQVSCEESITTTTPTPTPITYTIPPITITPSPSPTTTPTAECECGVANRDTRIVGGVETVANEFPWQVGLALSRDSSPFCGGSIVSGNTVVTAAHCTEQFRARDIWIIVGDHDTTVDDGEERMKVCKKKEHPGYNEFNSDNDIAVLTLCDPLTFSRNVRPVCLPHLPGPAYDSVLATVSGWGALSSGGSSPDKLMKVNVTTMDNTECDGYYDREEITDNMICASGPGKDACQGDSGGPLIAWESESFYSLIGVVSWGYGCASPSYPGVYSRVTENLEFVNENIQGETCKVPGETPAPTGETPVPMTTTTPSPAPTGETTVPIITTTPNPAPTGETTVPIITTTPPIPITTAAPSGECRCGMANRATRIVGGEVTEVNEYPWQIMIILDIFPGRPWCGGSILSSRTILTAAHCTEGHSARSMTVVVSEHDWTDPNDGQIPFSVCSKLEHPSYDSFTTDYDFAILTLCDEITFNQFASPVCLPPVPTTDYSNVPATVSGWGTLSFEGPQPDQLMEVTVQTVSNTACKTAYGGSITDQMICAAKPGKDACQGDSGGPLITAEPGGYYSLIGVVSWGRGCAEPDYPGVYARVTAVQDFIQDNTMGSTCPAPMLTF